MAAKHCWFFLLAAGMATGQSLPPWLQGQYPAPSATGVPTNTRILFEENGDAFYGATLSLEGPNGASVGIAVTDTYTPAVTLTPQTTLAPSTQYTLTVTPVSSVGSPYSFSFTTGTGPDTTPPQLIGFNPPSGTTGVGLEGPFIALFNKRLTDTTVWGGSAVSITYPGGPANSAPPGSVSPTPDGMGMVIQPSLNESFPLAVQITVDPTKIQDASGNAGQGPAQSAHYTPFVATSTSGPVLRTFFPADGSQAMAVNVSIRVLFDRAVDITTAPAGIALTSNGTAVQTKYVSFANGQGIALQPANLLAANQTFQVTVGSGLADMAGIPLQQGLSFHFATGANPDGTMAQYTSLQPTNELGPVPLNVVVALRANKPIMPLAAVEYNSFNGPGSPAATAAISPDGQTFTLTPAAPLAPGSTYYAALNDVVDYTGAPFYSGSITVNTGFQSDMTAPSILAVNPANGSMNTGPSPAIQTLFSEPIGVPTSANYIQLSSGGLAVPASLTWDQTNTFLTISPAAPLAPNTTYTIQTNGVTDVAGNVMPSTSTSFSTGTGGAPSGYPQLLSSSPVQGALSVNVNTAISLTFNFPLNPLATFNGFTVQDSAGNQYPAAGAVSGGTLTIIPAHPLLDSSTISVSVDTTDVYGRSAAANLTFRTGGSHDRTPFQVTEVSPPNGATIGNGPRTITLTFNKAVDAATVTNGIAAWSNGSLVTVTTLRTNDDSSLVVTAANFVGQLTLVADSSLTDMAGNPLVPFEANYTFSSQTTGANSIQAMRPPNGATGISPNTTITLFFSQPVDLATIDASLVVIANGAPVAGKFALSPGGTVLTFQPSAPLAAGSTVQFYQATPIFTDTYGVHFTIASPPAQLSVVSYTPVGTSAPANSVIEFEFSADVTASQNLISLCLTAGPDSTLPGAVVPSVLSSPRPGVIRLTPSTPLTPGNYVIVLASGVANPLTVYEPNYIQFNATAPVTSSPQAPVFGPTPNSTGTPVSASVGIAFNSPIDPLSVTTDNITIQSGGVSLLPLFYLAQSSRAMTVTPTQPLPANATIAVSMSGLVDLYGNPFPNRTWTFTTGTSADFSPLSLLSQSIPAGGNPLAQIQPNEPITFTFNKPVNPESVSAPIAINEDGLQASFDATFSGDLRTLILTPDPPLYEGQQYNLQSINVTDLSGNTTATYVGADFEVAFGPDTTPLDLLQASPYDGQSGLPLNAEIIASFNKTLLSSSFGGVQLLQGSTPVPLVQETSDPTRMRLSPVQPLSPNTTYTLMISGVSDPSGNVMSGTVTHTFTTGTRMDTTAPTGQILATGAPNVPIRVAFSEPVSAATVDARSIVLSVTSSNSSSYYLIPVAETVALSADGMTATVTPANLLTPNSTYQVAYTNVRDFAGNGVSLTGLLTLSFTATSTPDTTPPVVQVMPPDGSTGIPTNTRLGFSVNDTIGAQYLSIFHLTQLGQPTAVRRPAILQQRPVPGTLTQSGSVFVFVPDAPLAPNSTYRIDIGSVIDLAGNSSALFSSTFTTAPAPALPPIFELVSSNPASGAVGVSLNSPVTLTFSLPVDPSTAYGIYFSAGDFPIPGNFSFYANTVTFTPTEPWPAAQTVSVLFTNFDGFGLKDILGDTISPFSPQTSFKTAASTNTTPPQLLSASPPAGTTLTSPSVEFSLTFSENVAVGSNGLTEFIGTQATPINEASYAVPDYNTLQFTLSNLPANSQVAIAGSATITDRFGNAIAPFMLQYPTGTALVTGPPAVSSVSPRTYSTGVAPSTPIVLQFNKPMDPASLMQSVFVTDNGDVIAGTLALSNDNATAQFTPANPYAPGSRVDVFVTETAADTTGLTFGTRYDSYFTVDGTASPTAVSAVSFGSAVVPEAAPEISFPYAVDPRTVSGQNVWLRAGQQSIPGTVVLRGDRIIRFQPAAPLNIGVDYVLTIGPGVHTANGSSARPEEFQLTVELSSAAANAETVELEGNTASTVHVHFSLPVSPLTADRAAVIGADGNDIPVTRRISADFRDLWLSPVNASANLEGASLALVDVEDRTGRRVAPWREKLSRKSK